MRQQTMGVIDYGATEAGVVILMIPAAILFLALQKYYVKGLCWSRQGLTSGDVSPWETVHWAVSRLQPEQGRRRSSQEPSRAGEVLNLKEIS